MQEIEGGQEGIHWYFPMDHIPGREGNTFPLLSRLGKGVELSDRERKDEGEAGTCTERHLGTPQPSNLILFNGLCNLVINLVIRANGIARAGNEK